MQRACRQRTGCFLETHATWCISSEKSHLQSINKAGRFPVETSCFSLGMSVACSTSQGAKARRPCFAPDPVSKIFLRGAEITHPSFPSTLDALFRAGCRASGAVQLPFAFRCPQPFPLKKNEIDLLIQVVTYSHRGKAPFSAGNAEIRPPSCLPVLDALFRVGY